MAFNPAAEDRDIGAHSVISKWTFLSAA